MTNKNFSSPPNNARGHRARLRRRFLDNPYSLPDYELLELLLGYVLLRRDTKPLAKELLKSFGSLQAVFEAPGLELKNIKGFGHSLETFWAVLRECELRLGEIPRFTKIMLDTPDKVVDMARKRLAGYHQEEIWGAFLDNQNRLLLWHCLSNETDLFIPHRDVVAKAIKFHASGIILVHNHPEGDAAPSPQDIDFTNQLACSAKIMEVRLLDHIIVTAEQYFSMRNRNMLK